jgi:hypothetical protein
MTMRIPKQLVLLTLILFLAVETGHSTMTVVQKEISVGRALAGHVLVQGTDEPAIGVTVELRSSDWKTVLASTKTDEKGYFSCAVEAAGRAREAGISSATQPRRCDAVDVAERSVHTGFPGPWPIDS